jgi:predicted alpha/beta hydrolase family esterase
MSVKINDWEKPPKSTYISELEYATTLVGNVLGRPSSVYLVAYSAHAVGCKQLIDLADTKKTYIDCRVNIEFFCDLEIKVIPK